MQIAILDNDLQQRALLVDALTNAQHACTSYEQISGLKEGLRAGQADLLVYHWQPEAEGLRQLREIRQAKPALPTLLLTGRALEQELAEVLAGGCCDYLVKPLRRTELMMRVRVLFARAHPEVANAPTLDFGPYAFDVRAARLKLHGQPIEVTQKEFDLALLFFRNLGRPLSRATILEAVWPQDTEFSSRSMDTHVSRVRSKLGLRPANGFRLAPVYSYGYCLEQLAGQAA
jgi:DNA-binding response OmpR family regulator